jgi:hypothetical protein
MNDLAVLVADKNTEAALTALLARPQALGIRPIAATIFVHPRRDPGCVNESHLFLKPFVQKYHHALVVFDHEGSGREDLPPHELAAAIGQQLGESGWRERSQAIVIAPELEVWVWSSSPHVAQCIGWGDRPSGLHHWLSDAGHWPMNQAKPRHPKEALEAALREIRRPRSSTLYSELAARVSLRGHNEPAFVALTATLQRWFPSEQDFG